MDIISRIDAANSGKRRYYTGVPCRKGHVGQRFVNNGVCVICHEQRRKMFSGTQLEYRKHLSLVGLVPVQFYIHPEDMEMVNALVKQLEVDRINKYGEIVKIGGANAE